MDPITLTAMVLVGCAAMAGASAHQHQRQQRQRAALRTKELATHGLAVVDDRVVASWRRLGDPDGLVAELHDDTLVVRVMVDGCADKLDQLWANVGPLPPEPRVVPLPTPVTLTLELGAQLCWGGLPATSIGLLSAPDLDDAWRAVLYRRTSAVGQAGARHGRVRWASGNPALVVSFDVKGEGSIEADAKDVLDRAHRLKTTLEARLLHLPVLREAATSLSETSVSSSGSPVAIRSLSRLD